MVSKRIYFKRQKKIIFSIDKMVQKRTSIEKKETNR